MATCGPIAGIDRPVIEHVAHSGLAIGGVRGVDRFDGEGRPLSDHDGVVVTLRL